MIKIKNKIIFHCMFFLVTSLAYQSCFQKKNHLINEQNNNKNIGVFILGGVMITQSNEYLIPLKNALIDNYELNAYLINIDLEVIDKCTEGKYCLNYIANEIEKHRLKHDLGRVVVIGHSWGGTVALNYTLEYLNKVEKLILINTGGLNSNFYSENFFYRISQSFTKEMKNHFSKEVKNHLRGESVELSELADSLAFYHLTFNKTAFPSVWNSFLKTSHDDVYQAATGVYLTKNQFNLKSKLSTSKLNISLITGDSDFYTKKVSNDILTITENCDKVVISNSGHFPWFENPNEFYPVLYKSIGLK